MSQTTRRPGPSAAAATASKVATCGALLPDLERTHRTPRGPTRAVLARAAVLLVVGGALSIGCKQREKTPVERGQGIYVRTCSGCHGVDGKGGGRAAYNPPPRDLSDPTLFTQLGEAGVRRTIQLGKGQMPGFGPYLPQQDEDDLVAFLKTLSAKP